MTDAGMANEQTEVEQLQSRIRELEHERKHLLATVEILQEISGTLHVVDIMQGITRKLGETFGLDRCSIFLAESGQRTARLVASYEDPSIRDFVVDLGSYPELQRALESGETVFIPDAQADPDLRHIRGLLEGRRVKSITVVPITWRGAAIGAIFLRSFRDGPPFSEVDVRFTQVVAGLAAKALRMAHRYERLKQRAESPDDTRRDELRRIAMLRFLRRLFEAYADYDRAPEQQLPKASGEELDRLVEIAMAVLSEEAKGT
ncbi:MAG: GAF domain-containing protein [Gemmatimonadales bacterium]|nr:GAF domain-containing protein [Gemmatimonadales bacterium]NIN13068.1 GAF domain-containing protein [Gemmatimonadales bacterium]NIN51152.1 GAF domain-containing protein [Gemmatimonadales bacterium]NIP08616.1 GAF domain-containing protein [Gemmatimonadales bacterium]NIR02304.1 GAF domain-containing protein [Gemmatimonadales bacterium]